MNRMCPAAALLLFGCAFVWSRGETTAGRPSRFSGDAEWVVLDEARIGRVRLRADLGGEDAGAVWDRAIEKLFAFLDRDGDGSLSPAEAARLPGAFDLRRLLWGNLAPPGGVGEGWKAADADGNGKLTPGEVVAFYVRQGVGLTVGAGNAVNTERLNEALLARLDTDRDGRVSLQELRGAESSLMALDRNEDELVAPAELVWGARYPGTSGSNRVSAASSEPPGLFLLPAEGEPGWAKSLRGRLAGKEKLTLAASRLPAETFAKLDRDGTGDLDDAELVRWRKEAADLSLTAHWAKGRATLKCLSGKAVPAAGGLEWKVGGGVWSFRADQGKLPELVKKARGRAEEQFVAADIDKDGYLTTKDPAVAKDVNLRHLLALADRDGDGKLSRAELEGWLGVRAELARGQVLVTLLDHGRGLFEALDADGDGLLSVRESRTAAARLAAEGCFVKGRLDPGRLLRRWRVVVSLGHPNAVAATPSRAGPAWFRAMDRNSDGDVSRREFAGDPSVFAKLDADKDGLVSPEEAAGAKP